MTTRCPSYPTNSRLHGDLTPPNQMGRVQQVMNIKPGSTLFICSGPLQYRKSLHVISAKALPKAVKEPFNNQPRIAYAPVPHSRYKNKADSQGCRQRLDKTISAEKLIAKDTHVALKIFSKLIDTRPWPRHRWPPALRPASP